MIASVEPYGFTTDALSSQWHRCADAFLQEDDAIRWVLSSRSYSFVRAYNQAPHRQLINANTDKLLTDFVREWGPFYNWQADKEGTHPMALYRQERDALGAWAEFIAAITGSLDSRAIMCKIIRFDNSGVLAAEVRRFLVGGNYDFTLLDSKLENLIATCSRKQMDGLCGILLRNFPTSMSSLQLKMEGNIRKRAIMASYSFVTLSGALYWMLWQDIFKERPFQFCARKECGHLIIQVGTHNKKYCTDRCSKTVADFNYAKRRRERQRIQGLTSRGAAPKRSDGGKSRTIKHSDRSE